MAPSLPSIAVPGERLGDSSAYISGPGTHVQGTSIYASIPGPVILRDAENPNAQPQNAKQRGILTVGRSPVETLSALDPSATTTTAETTKKLKFNTLPAVDSIILGRVTRVQKRQATLSILLVLDDLQQSSLDMTAEDINTLISASSDPANTSVNTGDDMRFQALIRKEDVRAVEKDRVVMDEMFRVGDIVRASVISMGDQSFFYATTARNELGVIMGRGEGGGMLVPVSWREMMEVESGRREGRKVAKPF